MRIPLALLVLPLVLGTLVSGHTIALAQTTAKPGGDTRVVSSKPNPSPRQAQAALALAGVPVDARTFGTSFTVQTRGGSGSGAVKFSSQGGCSNRGPVFTMISGTQACIVTATKAADSEYEPASTGPTSVPAALAPQRKFVLARIPSGPEVYGRSFTISTVGGSGSGAVLFSSRGGCRNANNTVTMTSGTEACVVTAAKAADANYEAATVGPVSIQAALATQQKLVLSALPSRAEAYGSSFTTSSTGGSGSGAVTFSSRGGCSNLGPVVTMISGTEACVVTGTKAADANYTAAVTGPVVIRAALAPQQKLVLGYLPSGPEVYGSSFMIAVEGGSGSGAVRFTSAGGCTNLGPVFTMVSGTRACLVTATKASDSNYEAATSGPTAMTAARAPQSIKVTRAAPSSEVYAEKFTVAASASSGLPVQYGASGGCRILGATLSMTSGTTHCTVAISQPGNGNFDAAPVVRETVSARLAHQQMLSLSGVPTKSQLVGKSLTISARGGSGLGEVVFTSRGGCKNAGRLYTVTSDSASCLLAATKASDSNYEAAATDQESVITISDRTSTPIAKGGKAENSATSSVGCADLSSVTRALEDAANCGSGGDSVVSSLASRLKRGTFRLSFDQSEVDEEERSLYSESALTALVAESFGREQSAFDAGYRIRYGWSPNGQDELYQNLDLSKAWSRYHSYFKIGNSVIYLNSLNPDTSEDSTGRLAGYSTQYVTESSRADWQQTINSRVSFNAMGSGLITRYLKASGFNGDSYRTHAGLNRRLDERNTIGVQTQIEGYDYPDQRYSFQVFYTGLMYSNQLSPHTRVTASGGLAWLNSSQNALTAPSDEYEAAASIVHQPRALTRWSLDYSHSINDGSGYMMGAISDRVDVMYVRPLTRDVGLTLAAAYTDTNAVYARQKVLARTARSALDWKLSRHWSLNASYYATSQSPTGQFQYPNLVTSLFQNINFGVTYNNVLTNLFH